MGEANVMVVKDKRYSSYWTIETIGDYVVLHPEDNMSKILCVQVEQGIETYVYKEPTDTGPDNCRFPMLAEIS